MQKKIFTNEESFRKANNRAYSVLHVYSTLYMIFLVIYMVVGFIVVDSLFDKSSYMVQYCVQASIELLLYVISIIALWKGSHTGKTMFTIIGVLSLYATYNFTELFQYSMNDGVDKLIRIVYLVLFVCKILTTALMILKLYQRPIAYIWSSYEGQEVNAEVQDEHLIQQLIKDNTTKQQKLQSRRKIIRRALHNLRRNAIILFTLLYGSIIVCYMFLFLMRYLFSSDGIGIDYVQRYILLASLFTALVWSAGAIFLFLYKRWARWGIYGAWAFELIRLTVTIRSTIDVFQTQNYGLPSILIIIILECMRYGLLLRFTMMLLQDPFIKAYWKK